PSNAGQDTENTSTPSPVTAPTSIKDPTVLLLADANNGFNNLSRYVIALGGPAPLASRVPICIQPVSPRMLPPPPQPSRNPTHTSPQPGRIACRDRWLRPKIDSWVHGVKQLAAVATRFPHSAYAGLVSCLAAEWQYVCRIVPDIGPLLAPIEQALRDTFLPAVIGPDIAIDDDLRKLLALGVKSGGLAIRDPTTQADALYHSSRDATSYLAGSLLRNEPINTHHHKN
ncbi:hypothetical protein ACHAW6_000196, partial [Cyclotella cf. meneghiniana]